MHQDYLKVTGALSVVVTDEFGVEKERRDIHNLVVTGGKAFIASRMKDATATVMSHMAVGSNATAAAVGQTALSTETGRVALSSTTVAGAVVTYVATFGPGVGTGAINEAAIFNAGAAGTMLNRTTFSTVNKDTNDTITITWTITIQ